MSMASSTFFRDNDIFPHLWRFLSSSDTFVEAVIKLMEENSWDRIGMVSNEKELIFYSMAQRFREIAKLKNFTTTFDETVDITNLSIVKLLIQNIEDTGTRIIFAPTNIPESIEIMCQATKHNLVWPSYVWIFPSKEYQDFFHGPNSCGEDSLVHGGLENTILMDFALDGRSDNVPMVSGKTYSQYRADYDNEYKNIQRQYNGTGIEFSSTYNVYANPMYDELWALALALNSSLEEFEENGLDVDYRNDITGILEIIEHNLRNVSFCGSLGHVYFNEFNEVPINVNIYQVRNRTAVKIGVYKKNTAVSILFHNEMMLEFPDDDFEIRYNLASAIYAIILYINASILFLATTVLLCISLILRKEPELLATSSLLNILIFFACYQLIFVSILSATQDFIELSSNAFILFCHLESFVGFGGMNMISATVLARLVRVYRIFTYLGKMNRFWGNKYLFVIILVVSLSPLVLLIVCFLYDPIKARYDEQYLPEESPPVLVLTPVCRSTKHMCSSAGLCNLIYLFILILLLVYFAFLTRKVNKKDFKDTKKVNVFVISFALVTTVAFAFVRLLQDAKHGDIANIVLSTTHQIITVLTLSCLIAPKVLPAFYYRKKKMPRLPAQIN